MTRMYPKTLIKQKGVATLFISVILIIAVTLVSFLTAKTVLQETKMTANNHRTQQGFASADAAMDFAIAYFNDGGLDHDGDGIIDDIDTVVDVGSVGSGHHDITSIFPAVTFADGSTASAIVFDNNNASCATAGNMKSGLIITTGTSDDGSARRTISQCVGTRNLLKGGGPKQTLISGASVGLTGSAQIINRYSDLNVWSADITFIGSSSAMETYIRPTDIEITDLTEAELIDLTTSPSIPNVQKVSSNGLGGGTDVYMNDTRLAIAKQATVADITAGRDGDGCDQVDVDGDGANDCTFYSLFFVEDKESMAASADSVGQKLADGASNSDLNGLTGIIWVDGDASSTSNPTTIGTPDTPGVAGKPALLIVDGDFDFSGGTLYGLLYVTGDLTITGSPNVVGTVISEGSVSGTGTLTLVYARNVGSGSDVPLKGATAIVAGSWHDW